MWRMYCVCLLSVIVVLDLLGQSHVNRNYRHSAGCRHVTGGVALWAARVDS